MSINGAAPDEKPDWEMSIKDRPYRVPIAPRQGLSTDEIIRRIKKSLAFWGTHNWEDFRQELISGRAQLFLSEHGVWVAQVMDHPRRRMLNVWLLAGELPEVMDLQKDVERYALEQQCDVIVAPHVRFGLRDILKKTGWQTKGYNMSLPVKGE